MRPAWLEIDLDAIDRNVRAIARHIGPDTGIIAVVKSNAYGHGLEAVARRCMASGARMLAVALLQEAVILREAGFRDPLLVLGATDPAEAPAFIAHEILPAVTTVEFARALSESASAAGAPGRCHIKIDSGMGRQGIRADEVAEFARDIRDLPAIDVAGVFSHFASSPSDPEFTGRQTDAFTAAASTLEQRLGRPIPLRHLANSAGIVLHPETWLDAVRPGALLYGIAAEDSERLPQTRQAMSLKARVVSFKMLRPGESVGYARTFVTKQSTRAAILPIGYADGYPRALSNNAEALVRGRRCPIIGRVSMDCTVIDVGAIPDIGLGEEVVLLGAQGEDIITIVELARRCDTCVEEIVARMGTRLPRVFTHTDSARDPKR